MKQSTTIALLFLLALTSAAPRPQPLPHFHSRQTSYTSNSSSSPPSNFFLVATTSSTCGTNSSLLPSVSATSLFAPLHQSTYLLRLIGPGYLSLPKFNLSLNGSLTTVQSDQFGQGSYVYGNEAATPGSSLEFAQDTPGMGLGLAGNGGCVLTVDGSTEGWSLCEGPLGETIVEYQGADPSCNATYIQAVANPPY